VFKRFIDGIIFGTGFGIAFVAVWFVSINYFFSTTLDNKVYGTEDVKLNNIIETAPDISNSKRFLGSTGTYSTHFDSSTANILASGNGSIDGTAKVNGKPLKGLKLKLALNGKVYSQWAVTDNDGKYSISVPYGTYVIDGYQLDSTVANNVLPNKINYPHSSSSTLQTKFEVSSTKRGHAFDLKFVDPVEKDMKRNIYHLSDEIILEWKPFPNAVKYEVQIVEKNEPTTWQNKRLFKWPDRPQTFSPLFNLKENNVELTAGKYYSFHITARAKNGEQLSETHQNYSQYDFEVTN